MQRAGTAYHLLRVKAWKLHCRQIINLGFERELVFENTEKSVNKQMYDEQKNCICIPRELHIEIVEFLVFSQKTCGDNLNYNKIWHFSVYDW